MGEGSVKGEVGLERVGDEVAEGKRLQECKA